MPLDRFLRSVVPPSVRAAMRRSHAVNRFLKWRYGGETHKPHPLAPYTFYFDGFRNLGWRIGSIGEFEAAETTFAANEIRRRDCRCAWDVGANVGFWSLFLASLQPPIEKIIAFEPDLTNFKLLQINQQRNGIAAMEVRNYGLSSVAGTGSFFADALTGSTGSLEASHDFIGDHYGASRSTVAINLSTIDAEVERGAQPPGFLKIDVEGHELDVLVGARQTLERHHPSMIIEVTRNEDAIAALLKEHGYCMVDPNSGKPLDRPQFATGVTYSG